jgi:RNA polymerase sigma factor (sigma-70 family)
MSIFRPSGNYFQKEWDMHERVDMAAPHLSAFLRRLTRGMAAQTLADQSDRQLVEQLLLGRDDAAFEALVRRHGPMVYRVCWRVLAQAQDAEDAFQATFLLLAQKLRTLRKHDSLASWLHGIAHRVALKARAQAAARRRHEKQASARQAGSPDEITWTELRVVLDTELASLPEKWRLPLILCYLEGQTQDEAAAQVGWTRPTLQRRLAEARAVLGCRLRKRGVFWSAALSAMLVADCATSAGMPQALVGSTVEAVGCIAVGQAPAAAISAKVTALTKEGVKALILKKSIAAAMIAMGLIGAGAGAIYSPNNPERERADIDQKQPTQQRLFLEQKGRDENDANTVLDKAIRAIGGEARLRQAKAVWWKARGKSFNDGNEVAFTNETTVQGLDQLRMEWEDEIDGKRFPGVTVLNADKGWRKSGDDLTKLDGDRLANQKRNLYLLVVPVTLVPLKEKAFQIKPAGEVKVDDKPAIGLNVTGPDGKDFNLFFDKKSSLLVKIEVRMGSGGKEFTQETFFSDFRDFDGIKRATRLERRREGKKILEQEILEFRVLDKVAPETFAEPK